MDALPPKMLSTEEEEIARKGLGEILASLPQSDLESMLGTVTNSLVRFGSVPCDENGKPKTDAVTHAINSILSYGDTMSLLSRRKMKKDYIAKYLIQKGAKLTMPVTKNALCMDALQFWGVVIPSNLRLMLDGASRKARANPNEGQNNLMVASDGGQTTGAPSLPVSQSHELGQQLGREFAAWYYQRLNSLINFEVEHFWPECNYRLELIFPAHPDNTLIDETMMNGEAACAEIKDLVRMRMLYFQPNLTDAGIRGYLNPYGLAQVMVCGVIHRRTGSGPVGVFEQMFGLMKDPRSGSDDFKIKFSVLRLREGGLAIQNSPPQLSESSLVGMVEEMQIDDEED